MSVFKCRRCRCVLFTEECVLTAHGEPLLDESHKTSKDISDSPHVTSCDKLSTQWFISIGCVCPEWITRCVNKGQWTKGKLLCPKCRGRVGSFDFTSHQNCSCGQFASPPVHLNRNRVDLASDRSLKKDSATKSEKISRKLSSCENPFMLNFITGNSEINSEKYSSSSRKLLKNTKGTSSMACVNQPLPLMLSETEKKSSEGQTEIGSQAEYSCSKRNATKDHVALPAFCQNVRSIAHNNFGNTSSLVARNVNVTNQNTTMFSMYSNGIACPTNIGVSISENSQTLTTHQRRYDDSGIAQEIAPLELVSTRFRDSVTNRTLATDAVRQPDLTSIHNSDVDILNELNPEIKSPNVSNDGASFEAPKKRHKRVVSDCSWLQHRDMNVLTGGGSPFNSASSSRTNSSEDVRTRIHGSSSRPLPMSTALLRKRYGHRRALSMTATSNRFEFLKEDTDKQKTGYSERKKVDRQVSTEIAEPSIPVEYTCPVCLDLLCNPHSCVPCQHTFCESCLRQLARTQPDKTSCPMCRQIIVQCKPQHHLSFLLKSDYPMLYSRRRKATRKPPGKLHPLPHLKSDLRHKLGVVMQSRLRGRRLQEICRDHFIMTFFVYTGAVALLLGVFLLLILVCCKSLFFLFLLVQWMLFGLLRFGTSALEVALSLSPSLIATTTEATLANRVILSLIGLGLVYKVWTGVPFRDHRHQQQHTLWRF